MFSPISKIFLNGRSFYVKRDDLIDPFLAGNKYRKLYTLLQIQSDKFNKIISYGGTQSNAMLAIAAMCKNKNWEFTYYTKPLSATQKNENYGNYYHAKNLGMIHVEIQEKFYKDFIATLRFNLDEKTFIIDQGGAVAQAKKGLEVLADEIRNSGLHVNSLATPSGTGTTALFLALSLPEYKVYTTPCVGDSVYLKEQMEALHEIPKNLVILEPEKKYHFAKPYKEFLDIHQKLLKSGVEFDMIYAPSLWKCLLEQTDEEILYIHSGGVSGNESMLSRYKQKGFL
ncbi:MAG: 1-aminocyclopropane-1-carboxylate deaminase [Sulfurimonas sp. RIFOXYD12_FULL_33_39]|uniref:1-aminocyclopropane-1-carboxylate deaminase n=1 Tax=unclassified Sulfurimonas TaxID=2623549 RepID=UPI0008D4C519|nr:MULTISPECIES: 1-aminocyclopropane-1-carboxylate deaminase [unclassified Sulfurimonas]OHE04021.1 MAG: 1-aminocyclopropane-1-carboxylate deaminase [Sulfurimonas sp. RIFCSPLOWO2_12_FULL_34_6]OHE08750.1 MAG: 1-aminocyclopropane-1-carboxylate deaminase [Sulfurimonas sp. RIFOXYD12_FULL_33_39]OHE14035.1 MAG: 1-aminocyclopropane-1-carboxylate deaminase [Sulfurimonas sp. RIFOXYD2_FULL_34_21]DAB27641.1 MAG TPA: 1-aminocyclopropane-1-carboxylate deaminase [Sulfurimonas sp. UBA10385]